MLHQAVAAIAEIRDASPDDFERTLTLLVDGLARERTPTTMPVPPPEFEQFGAIMSRGRR